MVECKDCKYCTEDDISSTRSEFRKGDDTRYWCNYYNKMVYEDDSCKKRRRITMAQNADQHYDGRHFSITADWCRETSNVFLTNVMDFGSLIISAIL